MTSNVQLPADPVSDAVTLYEDMISSDMAVAPPLPGWVYEHGSEVALVTKSIAVLAWLLSGVLKVRGFDNSVPATGGTSLAYDCLLTSWVHQLECLGMWHWLCYLLLQLSSPDVLKESRICLLIKRLLRNSLPMTSLVPPAVADLMPSSALINTNDQINFVLNHLHLPAQWLYDTYATHSQYVCDWVLTHTVNSSADAILRQVVWLINARQYLSVHMLVLQWIAPDAILHGEYDLLSCVLGHLDLIQAASHVPLEQWESVGHMFSLFLSAVRNLLAILHGIADDNECGTMDDGLQQVALVYEQMQVLLSALPLLSFRFSMLSGSTGFSNSTCTCWFTSDEASKLKIKYSVMVSDMASVITRFIQEMTRQVPGLPTSFPAMSNASASTAALPLVQDMCIMRTNQMACTCFNLLISDKLNA
ncbi:Nuclear pore complex protein Nup98-Nup96 [Coemansia erecta]|uniref:Nuclear pore complex protein Nup98-Nup96 n=1 Tax=Coemansia erecta TaxID=147472 RepID=A0A9W7Y085_9FUNG|nr:Nuclear pore complex protein Nup98-Nup96 [Coemansia erecta]